jgi:hypothetical protein
MTVTPIFSKGGGSATIGMKLNSDEAALSYFYLQQYLMEGSDINKLSSCTTNKNLIKHEFNLIKPSTKCLKYINIDDVRLSNNKINEFNSKDIKINDHIKETNLEDIFGVDCNLDCCDIITLSYDGAIASGSNTDKSNSMYSIEDKNIDASGVTNSFVSHATILKENNINMKILASKHANIACIGYAKDCIYTILQAWDIDMLPFTLDSFDELSDFITYINNQLDDEEDVEKESPMLSLFRSKLLSSINNFNSISSSSSSSSSSTSSSIISQLIHFSLKQLTAITSENLVDPQLYAKKIIVQSAHPYTNNMDQNWPVNIPGARYLKLGTGIYLFLYIFVYFCL